MDFVKTPLGENPILVEGFFAAPPAKVFEAWTVPEIVMKWFGHTPNSLHSAEIDLRPGGNWRFTFVDDEEKSIGFEGEYQDIKPNEKLVFTWSHVTKFSSGERNATPYSTVEVTFSAKGSGTFVNLTHSSISTEDARKGVGSGWEGAFTHLSDVLA